MAAQKCHAETVDYDKVNVLETLKEMTGGRGPDACIDAVGFEAHGALVDEAQFKMSLASDRAHALRQAIRACRKGGTISVPGVYAGFLDRFPMGAAFSKALTFKMGQTAVHKYIRPLMQLIEDGKIDPTFLISHRLSLKETPDGYRLFDQKLDGCVKVVLRP